MLGVEEVPVLAVLARRRAEGRGGDEVGDPLLPVEWPVGCVAFVVEEAQHGRRPPERAVVAREGGLGEDAAPGRADGGGAEKGLGVVRRDAQEDLAQGVVDQRRRQVHGDGDFVERAFDNGRTAPPRRGVGMDSGDSVCFFLSKTRVTGEW